MENANIGHLEWRTYNQNLITMETETLVQPTSLRQQPHFIIYSVQEM